MTLKDWLPHDAQIDYNFKVKRLLDREVVQEFSMSMVWQRWPGKEKNVHSWVRLADGIAVGWNENPSRGWSFPVIKIKGEVDAQV
jgi:hypothetical protein